MTEIRPYADTDAPALRAFFGRIPEGDRTFFREDVLSETWAPDAAESRWVAVEDGRVVGSLTLRPEVGWSSHVGELRIVVDPDQRRSGIGRSLARTALVEGVTLGMTKLVVQVIAEQQATVAMFNALGFEPEALLRDHVRDRHDTVHDLFLMSHFVDGTWSAMETTGLADVIDDAQEMADPPS